MGRYKDDARQTRRECDLENPGRDFREALWSKDGRWFENLLGLPFIGNPLGRFVRVSNRGLEE
jgi:hypothetical protein